MRFSYEFSCILEEELFRLRIFRQVNHMSPLFCVFTEEQLRQIQSLTIKNMEYIDELIFLPELRELNIVSEDYMHFTNPESHAYNPSVNHIKDFSIIGKLRKLTCLTIENDTNITELDITNLNNLQKLSLKNNPSLKTIVGLDKIEGLQEVMMYGNNITSDLDIKKYMQNTYSAEKNVLDISLYINMVKNNPEVAKLIGDYSLKGLTSLKFSEKNGFFKYALIEVRDLLEMYRKIHSYFEKIQAYNLSDDNKIYLVYNYMIKHMTFAKEELEERYQEYIALINKGATIPPYMRKKFESTHKSVTTYLFKRGNCEGIVNLMVFMLGLLGKESSNVHCLDKSWNYKGYSNHSVLRVENNGKYGYCDPVYGLKDRCKFYMMELENIGNMYGFSAYEKQLVKGGQNAKHY